VRPLLNFALKIQGNCFLFGSSFFEFFPETVVLQPISSQLQHVLEDSAGKLTSIFIALRFGLDEGHVELIALVSCNFRHILLVELGRIVEAAGCNWIHFERILPD
jgi:hypothetical protein